MGGRGAFVWAMKRPDFFAGAASLSGSLNLNLLIERNKRQNDEWKLRNFEAVFGDLDAIEGSDNDVYALARKLVAYQVELPRFVIGCGTEDVRYEEQHLPFIRYAQEIGLPLTAIEGPGGHEFTYWDPAIRQVIQRFIN